MSSYANRTTVPVEKSKANIEKTLSKFGARGFLYGWRDNHALIGFEAQGKSIRITVPMPDQNDSRFRQTSKREALRTPEVSHRVWDQAVRQRWRMIAMSIRAKIEMIEAGISSMESEFLPWMVLPGGGTVGDAVIPKLGDMRQASRLLPAAIEGEVKSGSRARC